MGQTFSGGTQGRPLVSLIDCPLTGKRLVDPVVASDGWSYERAAIVKKLAKGTFRSPKTRERLDANVLIDNVKVVEILQDTKKCLEAAISICCRCPITNAPLVEPVCTDQGVTYERHAFLEEQKLHPTTHQPLLVPNRLVQALVEQLVTTSSSGPMAYSLKVKDAASRFFRLQGLYVWEADRCCYVRHKDIISTASGSGSTVYASFFGTSAAAKKLTLFDTGGDPVALDKGAQKYLSQGLYNTDPDTQLYVRPEASMHMERGGRVTFVLGDEVLSFPIGELGPNLQELKRPANAAELFNVALSCGITRCAGDWVPLMQSFFHTIPTAAGVSIVESDLPPELLMFATKAQLSDRFEASSVVDTSAGACALATIDLPVMLDLLNFFLPPTDDSGLYMQLGFYEAGGRTMLSMAKELQEELERVERERVIERFENANFTGARDWIYETDEAQKADFYCRLSTTMPQQLALVYPKATSAQRVRVEWLPKKHGGLGFRGEDEEAVHDGVRLCDVTQPLTLSEVAQALKDVYRKEQQEAQGSGGSDHTAKPKPDGAVPEPVVGALPRPVYRKRGGNKSSPTGKTSPTTSAARVTETAPPVTSETRVPLVKAEFFHGNTIRDPVRHITGLTLVLESILEATGPKERTDVELETASAIGRGIDEDTQNEIKQRVQKACVGDPEIEYDSDGEIGEPTIEFDSAAGEATKAQGGDDGGILVDPTQLTGGGRGSVILVDPPTQAAEKQGDYDGGILVDPTQLTGGSEPDGPPEPILVDPPTDAVKTQRGSDGGILVDPTQLTGGGRGDVIIVDPPTDAVKTQRGSDGGILVDPTQLTGGGADAPPDVILVDPPTMAAKKQGDNDGGILVDPPTWFFDWARLFLCHREKKFNIMVNEAMQPIAIKRQPGVKVNIRGVKRHGLNKNNEPIFRRSHAYEHYELPNQNGDRKTSKAPSDLIAIKCFNNGVDKAEVTMYDPTTKAKARLTLEYSKNNSDRGERPVLRHHIRAF